MNFSPTKVVLEWASVFHWFDKRQIELVTIGEAPKRHRRTEITLKRLSKRRLLRSVYFGKKLVYALPRKTKNFDELTMMSKIIHGLACSECLARFYLSRQGEIIAERYFRHIGAVAEAGIKYGKTLLLFEYSTKSNFLFHEMMNGKINAYTNHLPDIEEEFHAKALVVFILDVPRETVKKFVTQKRDVGSDGSLRSPSTDGDRFPLLPFYFTDYETFLNVPLGQALTAPIYFLNDGKEYPLTK